jgi:hypothetical protein
MPALSVVGRVIILERLDGQDHPLYVNVPPWTLWPQMR